MHGFPDASSLLSLVSPPPPSSRGRAAEDPTGVLHHVQGLVTAAADAGVPPTSLLLSALARHDRATAARARRTAEWARLLAESHGHTDLAMDAHGVALLADVGHLALVPTRHNPWLEWKRRRASHGLLQAVTGLAHHELLADLPAQGRRVIHDAEPLFDGCGGVPIAVRGEVHSVIGVRPPRRRLLTIPEQRVEIHEGIGP